jgi:hypothetical protein
MCKYNGTISVTFYYTMRPQRVNVNYNVVIIIIINNNLPPLPKYENSKGREMASVMWTMVIVCRTIVSILLVMI